jgi:DNA mismatch repair protein MutS2
VNADVLEVLELPAILERVAAACSTPRGAELARGLTPSGDAKEVVRRQTLTAEAVELLDHAAEPPLDRIHDVRDPAAHAALGGVLAPPTLRHTADTISGALRARGALDEQDAPLLRALAAAVDPGLKPLGERIGKAVEEDGSDLRDSASPKLRQLRGELRTGRQRVRDRLE